MNKELREQLEQNIGRECYVLESCPDWNVDHRDNTRNVSVLGVGTYGGDPAYKVMNGSSIWWVNTEHIQFKPLTPPKPLYTSACSICQQPSRKLNCGTACSNVKCKSWKLLKKKLPALPKKIVATGSYEDPIRLLCPKCGELVGTMGFDIARSDGTRGSACFCCNVWFAFDFTHNKWYEYASGKVKAMNDNTWRWSFER